MAALGSEKPTLPVAATVIAGAEPRILGPYMSPDGRWRAEVLTYDCAKAGAFDEIAYEKLVLTDLDSGDSRLVADQILNCGGLGAGGLEGLFWVPSGRFFYFTDGRTGTPEGCGYWSLPLVRLDVADGALSDLGYGPFAPDGSRVALWRWASESEADLVVWDVEEGEVWRAPAIAGGSPLQDIRWSPDGARIAYLQTTWACSPPGMASIALLDTATGEQVELLETEDYGFSRLRWLDGVQLELADDSRTWLLDTSSGVLDASPDQGSPTAPAQARQGPIADKCVVAKCHNGDAGRERVAEQVHCQAAVLLSRERCDSATLSQVQGLSKWT